MKVAARLVVAAVLSFPATSGMAAVPVEGKDYVRIDPAQPTSDSGKIVVTEFFNYQCPHCYSFAKPYAGWTAGLPADVKSERAAVSIGHSGWVAATNAFYALSAMKAVPKIDDAFFGAIHRQRLKLADEASIAGWIAGQGFDRAQFEKLYRSFSVQLQVKRADDLSRKLQLPSVPSLVIDGRYLIAVKDDGDFREQLAHANMLIEQARRERAAAAKAPK